MHTAPPAKGQLLVHFNQLNCDNCRLLQLIEKVKFHHDVEDVLSHTVGVRVVNLLLCVIGWKPPDLGIVPI